jgi:putative acetyltransferase
MITIRPETEKDRASIHEVNALAFAGKAYSDGDEPELVDRLRAAGVLSLSLVAEEGDRVVGPIAFSPAFLPSGSGTWYALGPVSVRPERQGQGIGTSLIEEGLSDRAGRGSLGCILTGDPNYYRRFGFTLSRSNCPRNEPESNFMVKLFTDARPEGEFAFHRIFYQDAHDDPI